MARLQRLAETARERRPMNRLVSLILVLAGAAWTPALALAQPALHAPVASARATFREPDPIAFEDHAGYVARFDGVSLAGWDADLRYRRVEEGGWVRINDWNQYMIVARGGVLIHILNGHAMAVLVDGDPASSNNQAGLIGLELESLSSEPSVRTSEDARLAAHPGR